MRGSLEINRKGIYRKGEYITAGWIEINGKEEDNLQG